MNKFNKAELETVKLDFIEQFNSRKSPIRYSMLDPKDYGYDFLDQVFVYLESYEMYLSLKKNLDSTDSFQLNFIDKDEADETIKQSAVLFDDILLKQKFVRERVEVDGYYLHFYLNEFEVDVDDHYFFPCHESATNYISIILSDMKYSSGVRDVGLTLRYWDQFRYIKNEERFIPFIKSEMKEVVEALEKTKSKEHIDSNEIDKLIEIMNSYQENGTDTLHVLVDKLEEAFKLKEANK